jgi:O-Antigen ligase
MVDEALLVARILFWVFAAGVVFLPMRWAFFCFIVASHLDIMPLSFTSATAVGLENAIRIAGLPMVLLWRAHLSPIKGMSWTLGHKFWLGIVAYAAIAGLWGGFFVSAVKMVVYLAAYVVLFAVFCSAWANRWLDVALLRVAAWSVLALAVVQSYVLDNAWGAPEDRFTSFSTPQYFAACLVALLAILIFSGDRGLFHYATCGALVVAIVLSGSRYVFVSTVILLITASFQVVSGRGESLRWKPNYRRVLGTLCLAGLAVAALVSYVPSNRLDELFNVVSDDDANVQDVGTFGWRLGIYDEILAQLERRDGVQLFFGSGTSSGAALMLNYEPDHYDKEAIDANRVLHSEYLRALYEWGILGLGLLCAFLIATISGFVKKIVFSGGGPALAFLGVLPSIVIGLAIENVLAGAVSAAGIGILLTMTFAWTVEPISSVEALPTEFLPSNSSLQSI